MPILSATADHAAITVTEPDTVYIPIKIINPITGYKASLQILLKHMADINHLMLKIISKKYNISLEDIIESIMQDPEYNNMLSVPKLNTLTYVSQQDINAALSEQPPQKKMTVIRRLRSTQ